MGSIWSSYNAWQGIGIVEAADKDNSFRTEPERQRRRSEEPAFRLLLGARTREHVSLMPNLIHGGQCRSIDPQGDGLHCGQPELLL
jgi:hypothetical protein